MGERGKAATESTLPRPLAGEGRGEGKVMSNNPCSFKSVMATCLTSYQQLQVTRKSPVQQGLLELVQRCEFALVEGFEALGFFLQHVQLGNNRFLFINGLRERNYDLSDLSGGGMAYFDA